MRRLRNCACFCVTSISLWLMLEVYRMPWQKSIKFNNDMAFIAPLLWFSGEDAPSPVQIKKNRALAFAFQIELRITSFWQKSVVAAGFLVLYFSLLDCIMLASRNPMHHHHHLCIKRVKVGISAMLAQFLVKEHFFGAFEFWLHTGRPQQRKKCLKISNYTKRE